MQRFKIGTIEKTQANIKWYNRKGYHMTGETISETIKEIDGNDCTTTYIVFSGSWTRSGTVRDCGNHYIFARYSRYDRLDKDTMTLTLDVEDI